MDLRGKTALITGAARGIGQKTAQELANAGLDILGVDLNADDLQKTAQIVEEAGRMFWPFACDVSDEAAVRIKFKVFYYNYNNSFIINA